MLELINESSVYYLFYLFYFLYFFCYSVAFNYNLSKKTYNWIYNFLTVSRRTEHYKRCKGRIYGRVVCSELYQMA